MVIVSAVIPTRGRPELLLRAVRSVLAQTLREIEAVVVIDGQDPATEHAVEMLARRRSCAFDRVTNKCWRIRCAQSGCGRGFGGMDCVSRRR
jgi:glycosyltransferase involved in cell wall biosynthesis